MLDELKALFPTNGIQCATAMLKAVADLSGFLEQQLQGDATKINSAIDAVKGVLDQYKK